MNHGKGFLLLPFQLPHFLQICPSYKKNYSPLTSNSNIIVVFNKKMNRNTSKVLAQSRSAAGMSRQLKIFRTDNNRDPRKGGSHGYP